jgi:hypothetical protein
MSKRYRPNITSGFDVNQFRLIRTLGHGMNGEVRISFLFIKKRKYLTKIVAFFVIARNGRRGAFI